MTKLDTLSLAIQIEAQARVDVAFAKGKIAACHRATIAHLMPKFDTAEEAEAYTDGFNQTRAKFTAE